MQRPEYHIIVKIFKGHASNAERNLFSSWLNDSYANRNEYIKLKSIWDEYGKHYEYYQVDPENDFNELSDSINSSNCRLRVFYKLAASIIFLFIVGLSSYLSTSDVIEKSQVFIAENDTKEVKLDDGSEVVLRARSKLILSSDFNQNNRKVELQGEGYFDIAHNPEKPFIIRTDVLSIEVLGTSFLVSPLLDQIKVALFSGKVNVYTNERRVELVPNQTAIYKDGELSKKDFLDYSDLWWSKELNFKDKTLAHVFKDLESHYKVKIQMGNGVAEKRITTSFYNQSIEEVLKVVSDIHRLEVRKETKNHYYILLK